MAWTINNGKLYFNTKLYNGSGSNQSITGVGFQPDWIWGKTRSSAQRHVLTDVVRGINKQLASSSTGTETSYTNSFTAFGSDGFSVGTDNGTNMASQTQVTWNWLAAGATPSNTYVVKVVSDSGNKYRFDNFGTSAVTLEISEGGTFTFDQSDSSNNGHPLRFATQADGANSSQYTTGVTTNGTPGQAGAYTRITVAASAPTLFYYCTNHTGMGGQANTPTTNSFSSFNGTIQSNISPNTTSGFSIVSYTGNGSAGATIGHGLGAVPAMIIQKIKSGTGNWLVYHHKNTSAPATEFLRLNETTATNDELTIWNDTAPTSSVFSVGTESTVNGNGNTCIAYCFAGKQGYSKFGSYEGNNNVNGTFVYLGFKPSFIMIKAIDNARNWMMYDNKRDPINVNDKTLQANSSAAEYDDSAYNGIDFLSNGFKLRGGSSGAGNDTNGAETYIYMAFAENPFTSSTGTPVTAR